MTHATLRSTSTYQPDALDERARITWTSGDFGVIALGYERGAAEFIARLELTPRDRVLDVACGTGNLTIPAARTGATVIGLDIAPNLLQQLETRAAVEGLRIRSDEGNCEALPYGDASFDTVVTMFGAMFAARPERAAAELVRVCRPGGRIAMANWTPNGFVGEMLRTVGTYVIPPSGVPSPLLWGDEATVHDRLGDVATLDFTRRLITFEYPMSPVGVVGAFRAWYGPIKRVFDAMDADMREQLQRELSVLWSTHNRATDGTTRVEAEYLEVIAVRA